MGRALLSEITKRKGVVLVAALTAPESENLGADYGDITLTTDIRTALNTCDALIDFSHPRAAIDAALMMHETKCHALITGTTGYTDIEEKALIASAQNITLLKSGNFSVGICLLESLVERAAKTLANQDGVDWDISVHDIHHRHKIDAPSGTALMLGDAAKRGQTSAGATPKTDYSAERIGGVIGIHHVSLASELETLTLSHSANDRSVWAAGALSAALWAIKKPTGLYSLHDVLGL